MNSSIQKVSKLISEGRTDEGIEVLLLSDAPESLKNETRRIAAAHASLKNQSIKGILTFEQESTERARINDRLFALIEEYRKYGNAPFNTRSQNIFKENSNSNQKELLTKKILWSVLGISGSIASFFITGEIVGYEFLDSTVFGVSITIYLIILWSKEKL